MRLLICVVYCPLENTGKVRVVYRVREVLLIYFENKFHYTPHRKVCIRVDSVGDKYFNPGCR